MTSDIKWFYCQAGYLPGSTKIALLKGDVSSSEFSVINENGESVLSGELVPCAPHSWGDDFYKADFTDLTLSGKFRLEAEGYKTPQFEISPTLYQDVLDFASGWFFIQRCGCEVPGWHAPCHLDDGVIRSFEQEDFGRILETIDATGGWHDAGDYNKWTLYAWVGILGLLETIPSLPDQRAKIIDEVRWEVEYMLKVQDDEGFFYDVHGWHPAQKEDGTWENNAWNWWDIPEKETDNKPGTGDERTLSFTCNKSHEPREAARAGYSLSLFAEHLEHDDPLRERCINAALKTRECLISKTESTERRIDERAALVFLDLSLKQCTGDEIFLSEARAEIAEIMSLQDDAGWFADRAGEKEPALNYHFGFTYVMALLNYAKRQPDREETAEIEKSVRRFLDFELRQIAGSPFMHRREYKVGGDPLDLPNVWQGYNPYFCAGAYIAAQACQLWGEPEWLDYAERQVQWIMGRNPLGLSMVVGVGHDFPGVYHHRYATIPGREDCRVPGGVLNGMNGGEENGEPNNQPVMTVGESGVTGDWQTNEYWLPNQGWFLCALSAVDRARQR